MEPINIFDFDGTLTTDTWPKFWVWVKKFGYSGVERNEELEKALAKYRENHDGDNLETFFDFFNNLLVNNKETLTYQELMDGEKYIKYNPGVKEFIVRKSAKNYIVSGGLKEFLENLEIAKNFDSIYGTPVKHDIYGNITGIGKVMTDENKILAIKDILKRNNRLDNECRNVYYVGDGYSDMVAMKFVHDNGGKAIFVHQQNQDDIYYHYNMNIYNNLNKDGKIDLCCVADYKEDSILAKVLCRQIEIDDIKENG